MCNPTSTMGVNNEAAGKSIGARSVRIGDLIVRNNELVQIKEKLVLLVNWPFLFFFLRLEVGMWSGGFRSAIVEPEYRQTRRFGRSLSSAGQDGFSKLRWPQCDSRWVPGTRDKRGVRTYPSYSSRNEWTYRHKWQWAVVITAQAITGIWQMYAESEAASKSCFDLSRNIPNRQRRRLPSFLLVFSASRDAAQNEKYLN